MICQKNKNRHSRTLETLETAQQKKLTDSGCLASWQQLMNTDSCGRPGGSLHDRYDAGGGGGGGGGGGR